MKVAISVDGGSVSAHFGRCEGYVLFEEEKGKLKGREKIPNPGHEPFYLPKFLHEKGVQKIICEGIGPRALGLFNELKIEVLAGVSGKIDEVIEKYLRGELGAGNSTCEHF